ncbi:MAG: hypothetical protein ACLFWL_17670 [Candidatus Brocadiia bacterium]
MEKEKKDAKKLRSVAEVQKKYLPKNYSKEESSEVSNPRKKAEKLAKESLRCLQKEVFH